MKQYLVEQIQHLDEKKKELENDLKVYVQDKSLPLSDRWEIFCLAEDIMPEKGSIMKFKSWEVNQLIVNSYSRYQSVDLISLVRDMENRDIEIGYISIEDFKEEILDRFICGFNLDW